MRKPRFVDTGMRLDVAPPAPMSWWREAFAACAPVVLPLLFVAALLGFAIYTSARSEAHFEARCVARGGVVLPTYPSGRVCLDKRVLR